MAATIPTELIECIFEFAAETDTGAAARICLTNKLGQRVATPILYRTIDISNFNAEEHNKNPRREWVPRVRKLESVCRTLWDNPALAKLVKHISQHFDFDKAETRVNDLRLFYEAKRRILEHQPEVRSAIRTVMVVHNGKRLTQDLLTIFLIVVCSGLEAFPWEGDYGRRDDTRGTLHDLLFMSSDEIREYYQLTSWRHDEQIRDCGWAFQQDGLFNLREIHLNCSGREVLPWLDAQRLIQMVHQYAPKLEKIVIGQLSGPPDPQIHHVPWTSPVQKLEIMSWGAKLTSVPFLLRPCKELRSLSISFNMHIDVRKRDWSYFMNELQCCSNVENFRLDYLYRGLERNKPWGLSFEGSSRCQFQPLRALTHFPRLRKLSVPEIFLFGECVHPEDGKCHLHIEKDRDLAQVLPTSVQELDILSENEEFSEDDRMLLNAPWIENLHNVTVFNCFQEKWISKRDGEGSVDDAIIEKNKLACFEPSFKALMTRRHHFFYD